MIFGDRSAFAIAVERLDVPWAPIGADEAIWAALSIWVAGENISQHRPGGSDRVRDALHVPVLPLATWARDSRRALHFEERAPFVALVSPHRGLERWTTAPPPAGFGDDEWLDRRDAWWAQHFTGAATRDIDTPSVGIVRSDDRALVSWRTPVLPRSDRVFASPYGEAVISWPVVADALDELVDTVREWAGTGTLEEPVGEGASALEYYTGLEPDVLAGYRFLPETVHAPAHDPLAQILRDLTVSTATSDAHGLIERVAREAMRPDDRPWSELRRRLVTAGGASFEEDGYDGAQGLRTVLDLNGGPIGEMEDLLGDLSIRIEENAPHGETDRMLVAGDLTGNAVLMIFDNERTRYPWARRFEMARALGHLLLDPVRGTAIGAASGPRGMATRRRRAGAFAAEMLLPTVALRRASAGLLDGILQGDRFETLLSDYGVGSTTAANQLWNQGLISSTEVRDELIASV